MTSFSPFWEKVFRYGWSRYQLYESDGQLKGHMPRTGPCVRVPSPAAPGRSVSPPTATSQPHPTSGRPGFSVLHLYHVSDVENGKNQIKWTLTI